MTFSEFQSPDVEVFFSEPERPSGLTYSRITAPCTPTIKTVNVYTTVTVAMQLVRACYNGSS